MKTYKEVIEAAYSKEIKVDAILHFIESNLDREHMEDIVTLLKTKQVKNLVNLLVASQMADKPISDAIKEHLRMLIHILQAVYNYGDKVESPVSDFDYDRIYEYYNRAGMEMVTTEELSAGKIGRHTYTSLPGTLAKIYVLDDSDVAANKSRGSLAAWVKRCEKKIEEETGNGIDLWDEEIFVFPKWDGVSVTFEFDENNNLKRALTRGHVEVNEAKDVTFVFSTLVSRIRDESMTGKPYGLKTEVMVREDDKKAFNKKFGTDYKSTRSIASSIINTETLDGRENLLEIVGLRTSILDESGNEKLQELASDAFKRPYLKCKLKDVKAIKEFATSHRSVDGLNCDGAVIYIIDKEIRQILGRQDHKNLYEIAYKFNESIAYTKITGIRFSVTPYGFVFPTAEFEPVVMKGATVTHASLGSIARFKSLDLAVGDTVKVLYEIIPYLVMDPDDPRCKRSGKSPIKAPKNCPECGEKLEDMTCINPKCGCRVRGRIVNYLKAMEIKSIGPATVEALYDAGLLRKITDLYKLNDKTSQIVQLPGFETTSIAKMLAEIDSHKEVPAAVFMSAIGIQCCGRKTFEKIFSMYKMRELLELAEDMRIESIAVIPGISKVSAEKILRGVDDNRKLIHKLLDYYVRIYYPDAKEVKFIAVFHKIRSKIVEKLIEDAGGIVDDRITKRTDLLIVPNGFTDRDTAATKKALDYGVPIIEIDKVGEFISKYEKKG